MTKESPARRELTFGRNTNNPLMKGERKDGIHLRDGKEIDQRKEKTQETDPSKINEIKSLPKIEIIRNRKEFVLNGMVLDGESLTKVSTSVSWK